MVGIVSAFTVAHSITLALAALKLVSLPPAFIEPAIAATIVLAALDNVLPIFPVRRVVVTFFFGLIHGFGFAGVLAELNLPTRRFRLGAAAVQPRPGGRAAGDRRDRDERAVRAAPLARLPEVVIGAGSVVAIAIGVAVADRADRATSRSCRSEVAPYNASEQHHTRARKACRL